MDNTWSKLFPRQRFPSYGEAVKRLGRAGSWAWIRQGVMGVSAQWTAIMAVGREQGTTIWGDGPSHRGAPADASVSMPPHPLRSRATNENEAGGDSIGIHKTAQKQLRGRGLCRKPWWVVNPPPTTALLAGGSNPPPPSPSRTFRGQHQRNKR